MNDPSQIQYQDIFNADNAKHIAAELMGHAWVKAVVTVILLTINWIFGAETESLAVIGWLVALDTLTGMFKAHQTGTVSSSGFFRFALKIVIYFALLATGALVDKVMPVQFAFMAILTFLGVTEAISVMENLSVFGIEVPTGVTDRLKAIKTKLTSRKKPVEGAAPAAKG